MPFALPRGRGVDQHGAGHVAADLERPHPGGPKGLGQAIVDVLVGEGAAEIDQAVAQVEFGAVGIREPAGDGRAVQVNDPAAPVENDEAIGAFGDGHGGEAGFEQAEAVDAGVFAEGELDLLGGEHGERDIVAAKDLRRAGDVDQADDALVDRVADRGAGAGPALDALAEMLGGMHEDRLAGGQRRADAVGADHVLVPVPAGLQLDVLAGVERADVAAGVEDDAVLVGQHHHGRGFFEQVGGMLQRVVGGRQQLPALPLVPVELVVVDDQRRRRGTGIDAGGGAPRPGALDHVAHRKTGTGIARQERLPGAHGLRFVVSDAIALGGRVGRRCLAGCLGHQAGPAAVIRRRRRRCRCPAVR